MSRDRRRAEKVCIITGGGVGIGAAYAERLHAEGYPLALLDVAKVVVEFADRLSSDGGPPAIGYHADLSDTDAITDVVKSIESRLGPPLILVNNAAIFSSLPLVDWGEITVQSWDSVMAVNLRAPFFLAQASLPHMIGARWGRIVNIASTQVYAASVGRLHYSASKAGILGVTRSLAREVGEYGVTVNAIAPGSTESEGVLQNYSAERRRLASEMRSIRRPQVPGDLVGALSFLVSDDAGFITGQTLVVDGGHVFN